MQAQVEAGMRQFARLSAVLQLLDAVTEQPAVMAQPKFLLDAKAVQPLCKANAFYVFENLADGKYALQILFPQHVYFDQNLSLQVPAPDVLAQAIRVIRLAPTPLYPYAQGSTLLRGRVVSQTDGSPLDGVQIRAGYQSVHGKEKTLQTQSSGFGRYAGRFALALTGNLGAETALILECGKLGYRSVSRQVKVQKASMQSADIEMQKT